jgi:phage tail-like protein
LTESLASSGGGNGRGEDGLELSSRKRESALERFKKSLAEREVPAPQVEGYSLRKARKILDLRGVDPSRLKIKHVQHTEKRGTVVSQRPRPGNMIDLEDPRQKIELHVADQSLIDYLPHIYNRRDLTGRSFAGDFLWVMQHIQAQTEDKLLHLEEYFDPHECPPEFLEYLASWVALVLEGDWPEHKKRSLIKKAVELYHLRGTPRGLRVYLRLFTGVDPIITENAWPFEGFVVGVTSTVGVETVLMHMVNKAHSFIVHIPMAIDEVDIATVMKIHRIIEQEKPVHTDYYLTFAEPEEDEADTSFTIGVTSTVGVDAWMQGEDAEIYDPLSGPGIMSGDGDLDQ